MLVTVFHWIATVLLGIVFVVWNRSDMLNMAVKIIFFGATIIGVVVLVIDYSAVLGLAINK